MELELSLAVHARELETLAPAWSELASRSAADEPTLSPLWMRAWWQTFGFEGGRELRVALFHRRGRLVGLAPLQRRRFWYRRALPFRRIELLASGEDEADEICSDYIGVLAARGEEAPVARSLARALEAGALGSWDELVLPAMDGSSAMPELLASALGSSSRRLRLSLDAAGEAPYIALPSSWAEYLQRLPSSSRYLVTRSLRDFEKWAGAGAQLHVAADRAQLDEGKRVLQSLHGERWSAEGEAGVFRSPRFGAFHDAVMPALLDAGALELLWLTVRGEPVAALYNIVWNGKVHFYQSGRKLDLPKNIRPGIVGHAFAIQRAIEAGRREYDFLNGASRYKLKLALATRPLVRLRATRAPLREGARLLFDSVISRARARARPDAAPAPSTDDPSSP